MRKQLACKDCYTPMITSKGRRCEECGVIYRAKFKLRKQSHGLRRVDKREHKAPYRH